MQTRTIQTTFEGIDLDVEKAKNGKLISVNGIRARYLTDEFLNAIKASIKIDNASPQALATALEYIKNNQ